jgi:hypothetical protein
MCRNIRPLFNFAPPATEEEVRAAALQYVRKVSGATKPSKANEAVFDAAVEEIAALTRKLVDSLVTHAEPRTREEEAIRARERGQKREEQTRMRILGRMHDSPLAPKPS